MPAPPVARHPAGTLAAVLVALAALALCVAWAASRSAPWPGAGLLIAVLLAPLLLPLPGLLRGSRRACAWAALGLAPSLVYGCVEVVANPAARVAAAAVLLAGFGLFVALVARLRLTR